MKPRTAIRIRRERAPLSWDDERRYPGPKCPTCGHPKGLRYPRFHIRRGHRFLVPVRTNWRGMARRGQDTPVSKPIRVNWPVKVRRSSMWRRSVMGRTWTQCPDPFHEPMSDEQPEPRQSDGIRKLMRANAPYKRKAKARRHRANQSYQRR